MDIKKASIKLTVVVIAGASMFFLSNNRNIEDDIPKGEIAEILSLMNISKTLISMDKYSEKIENNNIINISQGETELALNEIDDVDKTEEDITTYDDKEVIQTTDENANNNTSISENKDEEGSQQTQDKRPISTPSRGESIDKEKAQFSSKNLNQYVLDVISTYSLKEGAYPYLLNNDYQNYNGVTEDLYYNGEILLKANPNGDRASHCTGITFEVFFKAMQKRNKELGRPLDDFNGMSNDQLFDMALTWFVAKGPKSESNLAVALEKYGLGTRINDLEKVRAGDFIDFSRENNSGHAVVFIDWIRKGSKIIGLKFWSSQGSTDGISYKEEYFNIKDENGNKYGGVRMDNLHIVRVH